jgi:hypothetical protein
MSEPEVWIRCPKIRRVAKTDGLHVISEPVCACHGAGEDTLIPWPFDEMVERMARGECEHAAWVWPCPRCCENARRLLRVALGVE